MYVGQEGGVGWKEDMETSIPTKRQMNRQVVQVSSAYLRLPTMSPLVWPGWWKKCGQPIATRVIQTLNPALILPPLGRTLQWNRRSRWIVAC